MKLRIKPIKKEEVPVLNKKLKGLLPLHKDKLKEQEESDSLWLIAWIGRNPVANIQIRFDGSKVKKVRENLKKCLHLESLGVAENIRRKGIATELIRFCEKLAEKKGYNKIGLSVEKENDFLKGIYLRRGYKDWKKGDITETWMEKGRLRRKKCIYLVKKLK